MDCLFGLARNTRLVAMIEEELATARAAAEKTDSPARRFRDFQWTTLGTWSRRRRVVAKAERTKGEANPRFVVTSLKRAEAGARTLCEDIYCARGDMENRIKECSKHQNPTISKQLAITKFDPSLQKASGGHAGGLLGDRTSVENRFFLAI
ncbi:transposase [Bradyrhizobium sp. Cham227]|nr:transposase [Bradyrhizobium brasilense]